MPLGLPGPCAIYQLNLCAVRAGLL
jgi:hypothetical protein